MPRINKNIIDIKTSATLAINELSQQLENEGQEVFKFGLGQSPFPVPQIIVEELKKKAHQIFKNVVIYKPNASKKESREIYLYCKNVN